MKYLFCKSKIINRLLKYRYNYDPPKEIENIIKKVAEENKLNLCAVNWQTTKINDLNIKQNVI